MMVGGSSKFILNPSGQVRIVDLPSTTKSATANVHCDNVGNLYYSDTAYYSTEEVDKKLAIKDKLIEKLSARLDELEKRVK